MSKAFTKEEDDGGSPVGSLTSFVVPAGPFHITARGAEQVRAMAEDDERLAQALARADIVPAVVNPERAALGVTVHVLTSEGEERFYRLVTSEERGLTGEGCSVHSPLGQALLGAEPGDTRVARTPRGREELEVLGLAGDDTATKKPKARVHAPVAKTPAPKAKTAAAPRSKPAPAPKVAAAKKTAKKAPAPAAKAAKTAPKKPASTKTPVKKAPAKKAQRAKK